MKVELKRALVGLYGVLSLAVVAHLVWSPRKAEVVLSGESGTNVKVDIVHGNTKQSSAMTLPAHIAIPTSEFTLRVSPERGHTVDVTTDIRSATRIRANARITSDTEMFVRVAGTNILVH